MEELNFDEQPQNVSNQTNYDDSNIQTLSPLEHIRLRPGMYVGDCGNGSHSDDGLYILIKEVLDNSIDEFRMKAGNVIDVKIEDGAVTVRDYGRGMPLNKMIDCVSVMNTSGKFDDKAFKKSIGLNGVGTKAVNALSERFIVQAFREGQTRKVEFACGKIVSDTGVVDDVENTKQGTEIYFKPDATKFISYQFREEYIVEMMKHFAFLNSGLTIILNGKKFYSKTGLQGLLQDKMGDENPALYPIIHLKGENIELAITHSNQPGEEFYSFVNGQYTKDGGSHLTSFKSAIISVVNEFYKKKFEAGDIRGGMVAAIAMDIQDPGFIGQTKTKLGSKDMDPTSGISINKYVLDYLKKDLDDYLHKNQAVADSMLEKIQSNKSLRDQLSGLSKGTKERLKKLNVNNDCLYDCSVHFNDTKEKKGKDGEDLRLESSIFITEGNSASGTITKTRNPNFQAVFSLRGKPMNSYSNSSGDLGEDSISTSARSEKGMKSVYENKVLSTLLKTLNIDDDLDGLRYNKIIIATDADVDGMHIRLLLLTFFLQYYPELVRKGHVYILETPLFRVKDKSSKNDVKTHYCYSDDEKLEVLKGIKGKKEITRFKGLGEISDYEFKLFIGKDIHLTQVQITKGDQVRDILSFFMGKNTVKRRDFIIDNLIVEEDYVDEKDIDEE